MAASRGPSVRAARAGQVHSITRAEASTIDFIGDLDPLLAPGPRDPAYVSHARPELLLFRVAFDGERDETIEQCRIRDAAGCPHLRVHADRGEPGNRVQFVQIQQPAVAGE